MSTSNRKIALFFVLLASAAMACRLPVLVSSDRSAEAANPTASEQVAFGQSPTSIPDAQESEAPPEESLAPAEMETTESAPSEAPAEITEVPVTPEPPETGCTNRASFVADVTIPDNSSITTGASFTKTWRLRNVGTCTWSSSYKLVFSHGDHMSGPVDLDLVSTVAPGESVDLSVELTAPGAAGTYQGFWLLRDNHGVLFGLGEAANVAFWVKIKAVSPSLPLIPFIPLPLIHTATLEVVPAESGYVTNMGSVGASRRAGDAVFNISYQAFLSFDLSSIPAGATITSVKVDFSDYGITGLPFDGLGCLRGYVHDYGLLDASDYVAGPVLGAVTRWCSAAQLSAVEVDDDLKSPLQAALGSARLRMRVHFNQTPTDFDLSSDMVMLSNPKLIVSYTLP